MQWQIWKSGRFSFGTLMTASAGKGERGHPVKGGVTDGRGALNEQLYRPDKAGDHTAITPTIM